MPTPPKFVWLAFAASLLANANSEKTAAIDDFCVTIRNEFVESAPRYFSGPDPWVQLDRLPDSFADVAVATVYTEGSRVRWVVLEMAGPQDGWFETTHYFFDQQGLVKKRERLLEQNSANVRVEESMYFQKGKIIKTSYRHSPLHPGRRDRRKEEDWDAFYDPNAPEYETTADLPSPFLTAEFKQLALRSIPCVCVPDVLNLLQSCHNPC